MYKNKDKEETACMYVLGKDQKSKIGGFEHMEIFGDLLPLLSFRSRSLGCRPYMRNWVSSCSSCWAAAAAACFFASCSSCCLRIRMDARLGGAASVGAGSVSVRASVVLVLLSTSMFAAWLSLVVRAVVVLVGQSACVLLGEAAHAGNPLICTTREGSDRTCRRRCRGATQQHLHSNKRARSPRP